MGQCDSCGAALRFDQPNCSECGARLAEETREARAERAEHERRSRARRLTGARSLLLLIACVALLGTLLHLGELRTYEATSRLTYGVVLLALYAWARRAVFAAILSAFALYTVMFAGRLLVDETPSVTGVVIQSLILLALGRAVHGRLLSLGEDAVATSVDCASCGEATPAGKYCGQCGAALDASSPSSSNEKSASSLRAAIPGLRAIFLVFPASIGAGFVAGAFGELDLDPTALDLVASGTFVLLIGARWWKDRAELLPLFDPRRLTLRHGLLALGVVAMLTLVLPPYFWLLDHLGFELDSTLDDALSEAGDINVLYVAYLCVVVPILEEAAFRGYTLLQLERVMRARDALITQAVLFAAMHLAVGSLPSHFLAGVAFGMLRRSTGSLYPSIFVHALWNAAVLASDLYGAELL